MRGAPVETAKGIAPDILQPKAKSVPQIPPLTSLRFLAAISVVLYHSVDQFYPNCHRNFLYQHYIKFGYSGVCLFFVLSGFILAYNYVSNSNVVHKRVFWITRLARIYPLYVISLFSLAPLLISRSLTRNGHNDQHHLHALGNTISMLGANLLMLQAWWPRLMGGWNPPGWTLSVETFFYLTFPWIALPLWKKAGTKSSYYLLAGIWLLAISIPGFHQWRVHFAGAWTNTDEMLTKMPLLALPEFAFGIVVARICYDIKRNSSAAMQARIGSYCTWVAIGGLVAIAFLPDNLRPSRVMINTGLLTPLYGAIMLGLALIKGPISRFFSQRWFTFLGEASFAVYLLHFPILWWFGFITSPKTPLSDFASIKFPVNDTPLYLAYLVVVLGTASLAFRYIETPARRAIMRRWGRA